MPAVSAVPAIDTAVRRCAAVVAAGILLPPVLAGCGGDEDTSEGKSGAARDVSVVARDRIASGGTLRWAVDATPPTLNTFQTDANATTDRIADATLPALFTLDSRARPRLNPDYLKSAEVTEREPHQVVVYTLNPKARWSDGKRIGVADFQAQWKALSGSSNAYWTARNDGYDRIHKVEKGDEPRQVKVTFAKTYSDWQSLFTPLYPKAVMGKPEAFNDDTRTRLAVAGGPFQLKGGKLDGKADAVTLERNPKWWGDRAKLDEIVLTAIGRNKREKALLAGKLDLAEVDQPLGEKVVAANAPERKTVDSASPSGKKPEDGKKSEDKNAEDAKDAEDAEDAEDKNGSGHGGPEQAVAPPQEEKKAEDDGGDGGTGGGKGEDKADEKARAEAQKRAAAKAKAAAEKKKLRGFTVRRAYDPAYTQLALNGASGPLRDERVRRALAQALDREKLAKDALEPAGLPGKPLGSHLRMFDQDGYHDNSGAIGDADTDAASKLLADAGWKGGPSVGQAEAEDAKADRAEAGKKAEAGEKKETSHHVVGAPVFTGLTHSAATGHAAVLRQAAHADARSAETAEENWSEDAAEKKETAEASMEKAKEAQAALARFVGGLLRAEGSLVRTKDGQELELRMVLPAGDGSEQLRDTGKRIARMLERVGVRTKVNEVRDKAFFEDHIAAGDFDLALYSWPASAYPVTDARPIFAKPEPAPDGSLLVEQNYTRVGTDQIDQLFEQAAGELDGKAKNDLIKRIDARVWAVAGSVPLYQRPQLVAAGKKLANVGAFGFETPRYQDIGYVK